MRKDKCLFCSSRRCYTRVVSSKDNGKMYDEIACSKHVDKLYRHSDNEAPKVMKLFQSSTGLVKRGQDISKTLREMKKQEDNYNENKLKEGKA